ncbi:MAG: hypothetical protein K0S67_1422 [Nitrososphaeraceae archaeon]|nr:hypothetical protein [Nitrososphaeraceae archaeon]
MYMKIAAMIIYDWRKKKRRHYLLLFLPFHFAEIWSAEDDGEAQLLQAISVGVIEWLLLMAQKIYAIAKKYGSRISTNISYG